MDQLLCNRIRKSAKPEGFRSYDTVFTMDRHCSDHHSANEVALQVSEGMWVALERMMNMAMFTDEIYPDADPKLHCLKSEFISDFITCFIKNQINRIYEGHGIYKDIFLGLANSQPKAEVKIMSRITWNKDSRHVKAGVFHGFSELCDNGRYKRVERLLLSTPKLDY